MPDLVVLDDGRIMGGGQRFALRLCAAISADRQRWDVTIACPGGSALADEAGRLGVAVADVPFPDPAGRALAHWPGAVARMRTLLRASPPRTVVLANAVRASAVAILAGASRRGPLLHVMHERESAARGSVRRVLPHFGVLVAVGAATAAAYREALGASARIEQVNNFLLATELDRLMALRGEVPGGEPPDVGVLSRLIPAKGVLELVEELAEVPDAWSCLLVAGTRQDEAYAREIEATVRANGLDGRVELLGHLADVTRLIGRVDVLVVPSVGGEAQPTAVLEALAAGRRVVVREHVWSSDFAGLPVRRYGSTGELGAALRARDPAAPPDLVAARFGTEQAVAGIARAASRAS
jgi:glycosyltransferase involved in cell wall biosynthesis